MRETACNLIVERLLPTRENKLLVTSRKGFSPSLVEKISRTAPGFWDVKPAIQNDHNTLMLFPPILLHSLAPRHDRRNSSCVWLCCVSSVHEVVDFCLIMYQY